MRTLCILLLFSFPVCGQVSSSPPANAVASSAHSIQYTAADTVAALHQLFRARRAGGYTLLVTGIGAQLATPAIAGALSTRHGEYGNLVDIISGIGLGFLIALPITIFSGNKIANYSPKKEQKVIALYRETHVVPSKFAKNLVIFLGHG